ncbi:unnamed protein product [Rhizoctonia solani]|uniref:DUF659 domain-containing protein n=2 Tax=Rhizoctonia solani TaxID=456999 RepID=A0A8H3BCS6_9AGAM|nr:unnamed protein product [Rhizoctonia solani]
MPEDAKDRLQAEDAQVNGPPAGPTNTTPLQYQSLATIPATRDTISARHPKTHPIHLTYPELQEFHRDLLRLFAANNFPLHAIGSPETHIFFQRWFPGPELPTRQALGGRILDAAVSESKERMKVAVNGKLATGISDGWKSMKKSLLAGMINVDYKAYTVKVVDISALPKTAENHLNVVRSMIEFCESKLSVEIIGWVSDAGGDSRAMRMRLGKERPDLILLDCWAHQIELIVGDIFKTKGDLVAAGTDAQLVIKWFLSHSRAFALLQSQQRQAGGQPHSYVLPSHGPLQATVALYRNELEQIGLREPERVACVLDTVSRTEFFTKLTELAAYLRPLAIALNVAQAADTRIDHVAVMLGNLYRLFDVDEIDPVVRDAVLGSVQRRYGKTDQDILNLAVFLNPYLRARLFNPNNPAFCANGLYTMVKRVHKRIFKTTPSSEFFEAYLNYYHWRGEFSHESWHLDEHAAMYHNDGKSINTVAVWLAVVHPGLANTGLSQLVKLAIRVHSVVANSAGAERLFSEMGHIQGSKRRNRLHYDKVHDLATVRIDLKRQHQAAGLVRKRARRHFDSTPFESTPQSESEAISDQALEVSDDEDEDDHAPVDLKVLAARLADATVDDEDDPEAIEDVGPVSSTHSVEHQQPRVRLFFGTARPIPLRVFWKDGVRILSKEREVYEMISTEVQTVYNNTEKNRLLHSSVLIFARLYTHSNELVKLYLFPHNKHNMAGDLSELLFLVIGWFGWKSAATAFFGSVILLFLLSVRSEVDAKTSYGAVLARRRANPQELEYTLVITTGFFLFMLIVPVVADLIGL